MGSDSGNGDRSGHVVAAISVIVVLVALAVVLVSARSGPEERTIVVVEQVPATPATDGFAEAPPTPDRPAIAPRERATPTSRAPEREAAPGPTAGEHPVVWVRPGRRVVLRDAPGGDPVAKVGDETDFGSPSVFSVVRHTGTWLAAPSPAMPNGEPAWIRADPRRLLGGYVDYSVRVDLSERRAELLRRGVVIRRWPVTIGAPGSETPTGTFAVTDVFRGDLNPAYGCCAVALTATQPNLPPDWPGGDRIAIHGTDAPLGEAASHGCIRSADEDVGRLVDTVPLGTPVRIEP